DGPKLWIKRFHFPAFPAGIVNRPSRRPGQRHFTDRRPKLDGSRTRAGDVQWSPTMRRKRKALGRMQGLFVRWVEDVACTLCGCVYDDLRITLDRGRVVQADGACRLAEPWFLGQGGQRPPVALIEGRPVPLEAAVGRAADILSTARSQPAGGRPQVEP